MGLAKFQLTVEQANPHGCLISSISTYPVISSIWDHWNLIENGTIDEIQQAFASGALHPFTRDVNGDDLLHVSILPGYILTTSNVIPSFRRMFAAQTSTVCFCIMDSSPRETNREPLSLACLIRRTA